MEIIKIGSKFEDIKYNAFWSRYNIDSGMPIKYCEDYKKHLQDCINHPTTGMLARKKYITGESMEYPINAESNIKYLENLPDVKLLQKSFKEKINKLYPRTKYARQYIVDNERVKLDSIEPVKKYTRAEKIKIFLKRFKIM